MNRSQEQLLHLLTLAIQGGVPDDELFSSINSEELFNLSIQMNVLSFLFPTLNKHREIIKLDEQVMRRWKEVALVIASRQMKMMNGIRIIFDLFKSNDISVISIKGLALKQLYPEPELRNTSDLDILIDETNIHKAIELLSAHGYHPSSRDLNDPKYMHIEMHKPGSVSVEIHRTLWHPRRMKKRINQSWHDHIWANTRLLEIEGIHYTALSPEDELINLIIHLGRHLAHSAENLQQFCDITLFIKAHWAMLDIEFINKTLKSMDLFTYYQYLLSTCHFFFGLEIPIFLNNLDKNKSEIFMNNILNSKKSIQIPVQITDESECWKPLADRISITRNNRVLTSPASVLEGGRQFWKRIKHILHCIPLTNKFINFLKNFNKRARYLRRIGVHIRY